MAFDLDIGKIFELQSDRGDGRNMEKKAQQLLEELIIQILLRLPLKSLVRFRCVCKSWFSLISDSYFATSHFELAAARTHKIMFMTPYVSQPRSIDFEASLNDDVAIASTKLNFLFQSYLYVNLKIGGSCRGFLFLHCHRGLYLWNPSTDIYEQIPWSPRSSNVNSSFFIHLYGFGYDLSTDDYLVVLGSSNSTEGDLITYLELFSFKTNSWKEIGGTHFTYKSVFHVNDKVGKLLNGAIHWMAYRDEDENVIVSFDLTKRRISEIPLPNDLEFYDLWVFRGLLSLWAVQDDTINIWVMEECSGHSSWTKTFVLSIDNSQFFLPICTTNCGDIVVCGSTRLEKYNDKGQLLARSFYCHNPHDYQVAIYTESLLPLPLPEDTQA